MTEGRENVPSLLYNSRLNTCMHSNHVFRVQTSPWYGWNGAFPGGLVKKTSHRVDSFVQTRLVQNDGRHALLRCTLQQCSRMMPSGPDSMYAPPAKPSYRPCFKDERAENKHIEIDPLVHCRSVQTRIPRDSLWGRWCAGSVRLPAARLGRKRP